MAPKRLLLGIDLGTSGLKAAIFDLDGSLLGLGRVANRYLPSVLGSAEQDPRMWWAGCCEAIQAAIEQTGGNPGVVAAVGICGFHHCPVFLDAGGSPVRPTVVTHDSRLGPSLEALRQSGVLEELERLSGSCIVTGHFPPIYHLVRSQDPRALDKTRWVVLAKDYLRYRLTGRISTEICDATGTNLIQMPGQEWSDPLCHLLQIPRHKLPAIGQPAEIAGWVTRDAAEATGLEQGTPVAWGGGDSHCALVGLGVTGSGEAGLLLGTNSTLRASFDVLIKPLDQTVWIQQHVVPGRFTVSASSMAGSSVLSWLSDVCFGERQDETALYREMETLAAGIPPGCDGLLFHPYLFGERSPFYDPAARGALVGIRHLHGKGHIVRSVMEGVACAVANCAAAIQAIARQVDRPVTTIRTGRSGGSRLETWRQILTDSLDQAIEVVDADEPGCLGAAVLAGVGAGLYPDVRSAVQRTVRVVGQSTPDPETAALYRERRLLFNDTYRVLASSVAERNGAQSQDRHNHKDKGTER